MRTMPDRESQILAAAARGLTMRQTGRELHLSEDTVRTYRKRILHRTGARNMTQAVAIWAGVPQQPGHNATRPATSTRGTVRGGGGAQ